MHETTTPQDGVVQIGNQRYERTDTFTAPNGHSYRLVRVYRDSGGSARCKLRTSDLPNRNKTHELYLKARRLHEMVTDGRWVRGDTLEDAAQAMGAADD